MKKEQQVLVRRLKKLCMEKGFSYYLLANKSSVPMSTLIHIIEGSVKNPGIFTIIKLCYGLEIALGDLFAPEDLEEIMEALEEMEE